uniref:G_PROTEIN_RECEP_F1_2 domain-containing protein n=1 Tax=Caenorhabditis tropicalis TaxID=1561998 RepID=A0A1I7UVV9_9PELO
MSASLGLCFLYMIFFISVCEIFLSASESGKEYIKEAFEKEYGGENPSNFNMYIAVYNEAESDDIIKSWSGIIMLVILSVASILVYFICGYQIMKKLNEARAHATMSSETARLQRKLLKALTVQTIIPIFISFMPSTIAWFTPVFGYSMGPTFNYTGVIALTAFPFFDPVAIICFIPVLRSRLYLIKRSKNPTGTISMANIKV